MAYKPESICFCLDVDSDSAGTAAGSNSSKLELLKQCIRFYVQAKRKVNSKHSFALVTLKDSADWAVDAGFTASADELLLKLGMLQPSAQHYDTFDLGSLIKLLQPQAEKEAQRGRQLRVILLYLRTSSMPQWLTHQTGSLAIDVIFFHDKPQPGINCPQEVYSSFEELCDRLARAAGHSAYIFETSTVKKLTNCLVWLLAHPSQRAAQQRLNPVPVDLAAGGAVSGSIPAVVSVTAAVGWSTAGTTATKLSLPTKTASYPATNSTAPFQAAGIEVQGFDTYNGGYLASHMPQQQASMLTAQQQGSMHMPQQQAPVHMPQQQAPIQLPQQQAFAHMPQHQSPMHMPQQLGPQSSDSMHSSMALSSQQSLPSSTWPPHQQMMPQAGSMSSQQSLSSPTWLQQQLTPQAGPMPSASSMDQQGAMPSHEWSQQQPMQQQQRQQVQQMQQQQLLLQQQQMLMQQQQQPMQQQQQPLQQQQMLMQQMQPMQEQQLQHQQLLQQQQQMLTQQQQQPIQQQQMQQQLLQQQQQQQPVQEQQQHLLLMQQQQQHQMQAAGAQDYPSLHTRSASQNHDLL